MTREQLDNTIQQSRRDVLIPSSRRERPVQTLFMGIHLVAVGPGPGIAAMMKAPQHHDVVALDNEEQGVVKSTKDSLSHLTMDGRVRFREPQDPGGRPVNGPREFGTQAAGLSLIPGLSLADVQASLGAEPQTQKP